MSSDSGSPKNPPKKHSGRPRNGRHLTNMSDVLQSLLENGKSALSDGFTRWKLEQNWQEIVGETIAKNTVPCSYNRGVLWLWVPNSAWMQQLYFFQDMIKEKVNGYLGREFVTSVRFTLNRRAAAPSESPE